MDRLLFDTAPASWHGPPEIQFALGTLGAQRVTFGSDYPHPHQALLQAADHLRALQVTDSDREAIASGNARRFYPL